MAYCACLIHRYMAANIYNDMLITFFKLRFLSLAFVLLTNSPKIKECEKELCAIFGFELLASLKNLQLLSAIP